MALWLPPKVEQEHLEQRRQYQAELDLMLVLKAELEEFNRELREIDHNLQVAWAPENVHAAGLVPGRYHLIRHNPGAPPSVIPLETPEGEFMDLHSGVYELLRRSDLWSDEVQRERKRRERRMEEAERNRKRREREELYDEARLRFKSKESPGVAFTDRSWTYRSKAPREKKAA